MRSSSDRHVSRIWSASHAGWSTSTMNFVLHLDLREHVWIKPIRAAPDLYGFMYCSFSGHILFPDDNLQVSQSGAGIGMVING